MAKRRKKRLKKQVFYVLVFLVILVFVCLKKDNKEFIQNEINNITNNHEEEIKEQQRIDYEACLIEKYSEDDETDDLDEKKEELLQIIKKYNPGLYYLDPVTGFSYIYNENVDFYAANTIKMLDALYIYNKALNDELDLDDTVTFQKRNYMGASKKMKKYNFGDEITLRELVEFAITVSDNTAHNMLVEYIGFNNLKEYGKSLGATKTLVGGDLFGQINVDDAMVYLKELYRFINDNNKYSVELKNFFLDSEQNYLDIPEDNINAAIKYGEYDYYYHENGIVFAKRPYLISILSTIGNNEDKFREINNKVYELHQTFYKNREESCYKKVYEK